MNVTTRKMVVEVWSDTMCPYCYMGNRMLHTALARFPRREEVAVVWKSYQLEPSLARGATVDLYELLAKRGYDRQTIAKAHAELKEKGARQGIEFDFSKVVVANTFDAHRLIHLARETGRQDATYEALFRAHFTEGRNLGDRRTLVAVGEGVGLNGAEVERVLGTDAYADVVRADMAEAKDLGIEAVPHFMFDREHEVIGAEGAELLGQTLEVAFREWEKRMGRGE